MIQNNIMQKENQTKLLSLPQVCHFMYTHSGSYINSGKPMQLQ